MSYYIHGIDRKDDVTRDQLVEKVEKILSDFRYEYIMDLTTQDPVTLRRKYEKEGDGEIIIDYAKDFGHFAIHIGKKELVNCECYIQYIDVSNNGKDISDELDKLNPDHVENMGCLVNLIFPLKLFYDIFSKTF
jgi:hypothetical protein